MKSSGPGIKFIERTPPHFLLPAYMQDTGMININLERPAAIERLKKSVLIHDLAWMIVRECGEEKSYVRHIDEKHMTNYFYSNLARTSLSRAEIVKKELRKILEDSRSWEIVAFHSEPGKAALEYQIAHWNKLIKREELYLERENLE